MIGYLTDIFILKPITFEAIIFSYFGRKSSLRKYTYDHNIRKKTIKSISPNKKRSVPHIF